MSLPAPAPREHLHSRAYRFEGYRRADGLWDIEGRITDIKSYGFDNAHRGRIEAGEPIHDMRIRLTLDDEFRVADIWVSSDAGPFAACPDIVDGYKAMIGERIKPGWHQRIKDLLGGAKGCTHISEMLGAMGTVAFQTIYPSKVKMGASDPTQSQKKPAHLDSCHALRLDGEAVRRFWPQFYSGSKQPHGR
jgi:hypothetical protein